MSRHVRIGQLRASLPAVLPSLLLCDFANLAEEVKRLEAAGVKGLHLDVMDGCFVPNFTYGMPIVEALRRTTELPLDVHLMIEKPERYIKPFFEAGADIITIHAESTEDPGSILTDIKTLGACAGLAINPNTPISMIEPYLKQCDLVLVMSVEAGFGGQSFNPIALDKIRQLKQMVCGETLLEIDGGVNDRTIAKCAAAGADLFVAGSAIFCTSNYSKSVADLSSLAIS